MDASYIVIKFNYINTLNVSAGHYLTPCTLGKKISRRQFEIFFSFFLENRIDISCKLSNFYADNLYKVSEPIY